MIHHCGRRKPVVERKYRRKMYALSVSVFILCVVVSVENYPTKSSERSNSYQYKLTHENKDDDIGFVSKEWKIIEKNPGTRFHILVKGYTFTELIGSGDGFSDDENEGGDADDSGSGSGSRSTIITRFPLQSHTTYVPVPEDHFNFPQTTQTPAEFSASGDRISSDDDTEGEDDDDSGSGSKSRTTHVPVPEDHFNFPQATQTPVEFSGSGDRISDDDIEGDDDDDSGSDSKSHTTHVSVPEDHFNFPQTTQTSVEFSGSGNRISDDDTEGEDDDDSGSGSGSRSTIITRFPSQSHTTYVHTYVPVPEDHFNFPQTTQTSVEFSGSGDRISDDDTEGEDDDDSGSGSKSHTTYVPVPEDHFNFPQTTQTPAEFSGSGDKFSDDDDDDDFGSGSGSRSTITTNLPSQFHTIATIYETITKEYLNFPQATQNPVEFSGSGNGDPNDDDEEEGSGSGDHNNIIEILTSSKKVSKSPKFLPIKQPPSPSNDFMFVENKGTRTSSYYKYSFSENVIPVFIVTNGTTISKFMIPRHI